MKKKAIVTGATGFVGSNLCRKLIKENWEVSIITRKNSDYLNIEDIKENLNIFEYDRNIETLIGFFKENNGDVVFHLASLFIAEHNIKDVDKLIESNLKFGLHILEAMKESKIKLLINTGTSWQHYNNEDYNPVCLYAATKEAFEKLIKYYVEAEGIRAITLKLFDTYGETDKRPKLINLLNKFADEGTELNMSPGEQGLDLVHIDDVVEGFIKAYEYLMENKLLNYEIFGIATGRAVQLKELINIFESGSGKKIKVNWGGREYRTREVMNLWNDYNFLPNWKAKINLEEGIKRYKND